jgi:PKD repeat protein
MQNLYKILVISKNSLLLITVMLFGLNVMAQKPVAERAFEISLEADEKVDTEIKNNMSINLNTGYPMAIYGVNFNVPQGTPEEMAQYYLQHESKKLGIPVNELSNLHHHATRTTNVGSVVRYRQYSGNYPVNKAEVTISISPQNKVVFVMNSYEVNTNMSNIQPSISEETAYQLAFNYLNVNSNVIYTNNRLMVYKNSRITRLAHEVTITTSQPQGEWHVFVDALTQEIFKVVDMAHYYSDEDDEENTTTQTNAMVPVDGTGLVFNPDPLSSNTVAYGTAGYVDGNDATTTQLDNARVSVTLRDIDLTAGVYTLRGPRAEIVDHEGPFDGLFTQPSSTFNFNRNEQAFEAVNVYYHIDFMMDYINNTLGCNVLPYQYSGGVQFDPHGLNGGDNSHYTGGNGRLAFGEGCVDDAEDSDVIHHELGHGLHDWVTSGGLSQVDGLSEGSGDYIAVSYNRGLGNWTPADPAYNYMFNWDGHNECWNGRIANYGATYPGGLVGQIHTDGQIWASCLMTVWDQIGQQEMDKIFYEGLGMTNGSSSQNDAANAVYQAAINLSYTTAQLTAIHDSLTACGYILPALPFGPPIANFSADITDLCLDIENTVNFTDTSAGLAATSWAWTFEGGIPSTSTAQNPSVTYAASGSYNVSLTATNADGPDTLSETDYITVSQGANCTSCNTFASAQNLAFAIPDGAGTDTAGAPLTHIINVPAGSNSMIDGLIFNVDITHTYINDLIITLKHPNGTTAVVVWDRDCAGENNLDVTFEDGTDPIACAGPTVGTYNPANPLSVFNGLESAGDWTISITDSWNVDTGMLNDWSFEICGNLLSVEENEFDEFSIFPNPNQGTFNIKLNSSSNSAINVVVYDIRGRSIFNNSYANTSRFNQVINLNTVQSGMYLVEVSDGERKAIKKIVVE